MKNLHIVLKGEPRSTNSLYRSVCRGGFPSVYMSNEGRDLKESYRWQAKSQYGGAPVGEELEIEVWVYCGNRRKHDIDNFNKVIFDSLTGTVWVDDSQIRDSHTHMRYDKGDPRIEISIWTTSKE